VLLGNGDGTFQQPQRFAVGHGPKSVAVADVNGDGKPDIVTANASDNAVSVLLGNGDGTFQQPQTFAVGSGPDSVAVADVNGDGKPDLVVANQLDNTVSVLLGNGDGSFQLPQSFAVGHGPNSVAVADVNGDGKPDIVTANASDNAVSVLLGNGNGTFTPASLTAVSLRNTPYLADLTGNGLPSTVVLNIRGDILFRQGLPGNDNVFAPPVPLNLGRPARDLTVLQTANGLAIATADASFDPALSGANHFVYTISLYTLAPNGEAHRSTAFSTTLLPTRIAAADLTGNGLDDLVVANSVDSSIQIAFQQPNGTFSAPLTRSTGEAPSDLALVDLSGDGRPDIVVSNQASGDVSVFPNDSDRTFSQSYRFRAGTGPYGLDTTAASPVITTLQQSVSLAAGNFTGSGRNDVVVVNRGSDSFSVLANDGSGGFANPQPALTTSTSDGFLINAQPGPIVAGDFHGPGQPLDLAIPMKDRQQVWIYTGNGDGTFSHTFSIPAGAQPTGLNLVRNPQTGVLDLLVGNPFGDVLHLQGKGDGTFQVAGNRVPLAVQNLGNGQPDVLLANQRSDRITIQAPQSGSPQFTPVVTLADGSHSTLAPGAVQWAKLDKGSPFYDAMVVASGGNEVLVYRGTGFDAAGNPTFAAPVSYPVGTNPVAVTIQDISGDGIPDMLVVNQGSNDITTLFGSYDANGNWVATPGPRLNAGGAGPVAVMVLNPTTPNGNPSLLVTNAQSNTMTVLPGVGQGFFNDQNPQTISLPGTPMGAPISLPSGVGVLASADGQLFTFNPDNLGAGFAVAFAAPAGQNIAAAAPVPDGSLVVALSGGGVEQLAFDPALGNFNIEESLAPLNGVPSEPDALEVLQGASRLEALVTSAGSDQIFVFGLPEAVSQAALVALPPPVLGAPVVSATTPTGAVAGRPEAFLPVVTLLTGNLAPGESSPGPAAAAEEASVAVGATNRFVTDLLSPTDPTQGDEEGEAPGPDQPPQKESGLGPDVEEGLKKLDLKEPAPPAEPPGAASRRHLIEESGADDPFVTALAELLSEFGPWTAAGSGVGSKSTALVLHLFPTTTDTQTVSLAWPEEGDLVQWEWLPSHKAEQQAFSVAGREDVPPPNAAYPIAVAQPPDTSSAEVGSEWMPSTERPPLWCYEAFLAMLSSGGLALWRELTRTDQPADPLPRRRQTLVCSPRNRGAD
jgi:hypothetical protein